MTISRRSAIVGALAAPIAGFAKAAPAAARPLTQAEIVGKVRELAEQLSVLLADLDEGQWEVRVSPPFKGLPLYSIDPIAWGAAEASRADLVRYYGFLWCEFHGLAEEFGTDQHDAIIMHEAGGYQKMRALFGHRRPSERAIAMLRLAGGQRAVLER